MIEEKKTTHVSSINNEQNKLTVTPADLTKKVEEKIKQNDLKAFMASLKKNATKYLQKQFNSRKPIVNLLDEEVYKSVANTFAEMLKSNEPQNKN